MALSCHSDLDVLTIGNVQVGQSKKVEWCTVTCRVATICDGLDIISEKNLNEDSDEKLERQGLRGFYLTVMVSVA